MMAGSASEQIVAELRGRIESGALAPGDLLPSARQITREWHVAIATATRVHAALRDAGLAETMPGIGVVVRRPRPIVRPGGHTSLRADLIVATAIIITDTEGVDGLSMRRLAVELDTAPMSLYSHVADKEDLLVKMLDAALGEWQPPKPDDADWRECLEAAARGMWQLCRRHPWLASNLSLVRPALIPNGFAWTEWVLDALADRGVDLTTRFGIYLTLFNFVRGTAISLEAEAAAIALTGMDTDKWMDTQLPALRALADESAHPRLTELVGNPYDFSLDRLFDTGLRYLLDGLAAEIDSNAAAGT